MSKFKVGDEVVILATGFRGTITNVGRGEFSGRCTVTKCVDTDFNQIINAEEQP